MSGDNIDDLAAENGEQKRAWREIAVDLLTAYSIPITLGFALVVIWVLNTHIGIPDIWLTLAHWSFIGGILGYIPAAKVVNWLQDIDINPILELNLAPDDEEIGAERFRFWNLGDEIYQNITWDRQPYTIGGLDVVRSYDPETNTAKGVWLSALSEVELLRYKGKLREARTKLVELAAEGIVADIKTTGNAMEAVKTEIQTFIRVLVKKSTLSQDELAEIIIDAVDDETEIAKQLTDETGDESDDESPLERAQKAKSTPVESGDGSGDIDG